MFLLIARGISSANTARPGRRGDLFARSWRSVVCGKLSNRPPAPATTARIPIEWWNGAGKVLGFRLLTAECRATRYKCYSTELRWTRRVRSHVSLVWRFIHSVHEWQCYRMDSGFIPLRTVANSLIICGERLVSRKETRGHFPNCLYDENDIFRSIYARIIVR